MKPKFSERRSIRGVISRTTLALFFGLAGLGCGSSRPAPAPPAPAPKPPMTFADDLAFLEQHGPVHVLTTPEGGRVALSARYQGRVMTSSVAPDGPSFGWIHRTFIGEGKTGTAFDNFGGEDRLWLGPEGGQYGLYFPKGSAFTFDAWQVPHAMQEGAWEMKDAGSSRAVFTKTMRVTNWSGTTFDVAIERTVSLVDPRAKLGELPKGVRAIAFQSDNRLTNVGSAAWKRETGLPSIWILAMYAPAKDGRVIVPFETKVPAGTPLVNDAYFGKVPAGRLAVHEDKGFLSFVVDGELRSKIGLGPLRAKNRLGSYSATAKLLTVVEYEPGPSPTKPYVNSMWEEQKTPYAGDVVNSYNDGPTGPGKPPLGGFYELETSSPGAELAPKESLVHVHRTFHFVGEKDALDAIAKNLLGVSLASVTDP